MYPAGARVTWRQAAQRRPTCFKRDDMAIDTVDRSRIVIATRVAAAVLSVAALSSAHCGGSSPSAPTSPVPPTVSQITLSGPTRLTSIGQRAQFTASVRLSNGTTEDQTNASQWTSSDTSVFAVSATGLVTAPGGGRADLRAVFQGMNGTTQVEVVPGPPTAEGNTAGRVDDPTTVADLLTYHQNALSGASARRPGIIARWELPIPVYVDSSASTRNVESALAYWRAVTGLSSVIVGANAEPRILVRAGTDGLGSTLGRGLVDATFPDNRARSGLVVIRTDVAQCDIAQTSCAVLYQHEIGHAIGLFDHVAGGGLMSGGTRASLREINMLVELYRLPHRTRIEADGTWRVVP